MRSAVAIGVVLVLGLMPLAALAQQEQGTSERLLLIMDSSGSMNGTDDAGVPLIDGAKEALRLLISALPEGTEVGLRVYGHRVPNTDKANGCLDTELVIPVGPINPEAMRTAIDSYQAKGFTPIGLSLQEAADDLGGSGTIILVSDGIDTCVPPDPCEVAADLVDQGFSLTVHTVGLFLDDPAAEQQLQCIADSTGGNFTRSDSIVELVGDLTGLASGVIGEGTLRQVLLGSLDRLQAPIVNLLPTEDPNSLGRVVTGNISTGETRWYALEVPQEGGWHIVSEVRLTDRPQDHGSDDSLQIQVYDPNGEPIGVPHEVLGVVVQLPQSVPLQEANDWVFPGDPIGVRSVTDPHSAPPGWPGTDSEDPYMTWLTDRLTTFGLNRGLYELWESNQAVALEPGRYFVGVSLASAEAWAASMEVDVTLQAAPEGPAWRTRAGEPALLDADSDEPQIIELAPWTKGDIDGATPVRSGEVWTRLPSAGTRLAVDLRQGETLAVGSATGPVFTPNPGSVELDLRHSNGTLLERLHDPEDDTLWIPGYEGTIHRWVIPDDGRYVLQASPLSFEEPADAAAVLAAFVFDPASTTQATEAPRPAAPEFPSETAASENPASETAATGSAGAETAASENSDADFPTVAVAIVGSALVIGIGAGTWSVRRRRIRRPSIN